VEILGPDTVPPGGTARFSVRGRWSDGAMEEISTGVTWQSTDSAVISIDASGSALGKERGSAAIRASVTGKPAAMKGIHVLPDGTFRLSGRVSDSTATGLPIESALVEADSDPDRITALTNGWGDFVLYGVRRDALLRIYKDGYRTYEQRLDLTTHGGVNVPLVLAQPRALVAGTYVLSIGSPQCEGATPYTPLAAELRQRTYTAVLRQEDARVTVTLSGSHLLAERFFGSVTATSATFDLTQGDYYYRTTPDVIERLANGTFLVISGRAVTTIADSGLVGTLNGSFVNLETVPYGRVVGRCQSSSYSFRLTR
jgi:hypothetical protein